VVVVVTSVAVPRVAVALVVAASVVVGCVAASVAVPVEAGVVCVLTLPVPGVAVGVFGFWPELVVAAKRNNVAPASPESSLERALYMVTSKWSVSFNPN
jgi:hypothetical protein